MMTVKLALPVLLVVLISVVVVVGCALADANQEVERQAEGAAAEWLSLVDEGRYAESWEAAAGYFKAAITKEQWERSLTALRRPLGKVLSRQVKSREYTTTLPGAPDGEYVVLQFETSYENKKSAIETVTSAREKGGSWRVSGYFNK